MLATEKGHGDVVNQLLQAKASVNVQNLEGESALSIAIHKGYEPLVQVLLEAKSDPNLKNKAGASSLMIAVSKPNNESIAMLLFQDDGIKLENKEMAIQLMKVARENRYLNIASELKLAVNEKSQKKNLKFHGLGIFSVSKQQTPLSQLLPEESNMNYSNHSKV